MGTKKEKMKDKLNFRFSKNQTLLILAGLLISVILSLFTLISVRNNQWSDKSPTFVAEVGNAPAKGPGDAPITIIEYSDFECPFCLKFQTETLSKLQEKYAGKIRFAYKHFPLAEVHPQATKAALAASCAYFMGKEDTFFKYHDILFSHNEWKKDETKFLSYAQELGLDGKQFTGCMQSNGTKRWVDKDFEDGKKLGVERVPTFFINGKKVVGAQPFEFFVKLIEEELRK